MILESTLLDIIEHQIQQLENRDLGLERELKIPIPSLSSHALIISGIRRCGKSTLLMQILSKIKNEKFIFIDIFREDNKAVIEIKDNAGGIEEEIIEKVCEPYFTTKHQTQGTGIGLFMCKEIINKHMNGQINIINTSFEDKNKIYKGTLTRIILEDIIKND